MSFRTGKTIGRGKEVGGLYVLDVASSPWLSALAVTSPNKVNKVWDGKKKNAAKAKAEYAEIQSIANSIPFVMVEPLFRGYGVKGQGSCQAKKRRKTASFARHNSRLQGLCPWDPRSCRFCFRNDGSWRDLMDFSHRTWKRFEIEFQRKGNWLLIAGIRLWR